MHLSSAFGTDERHAATHLSHLLLLQTMNETGNITRDWKENGHDRHSNERTGDVIYEYSIFFSVSWDLPPAEDSVQEPRAKSELNWHLDHYPRTPR